MSKYTVTGTVRKFTFVSTGCGGWCFRKEKNKRERNTSQQSAGKKKPVKETNQTQPASLSVYSTIASYKTSQSNISDVQNNLVNSDKKKTKRRIK